MAKDTQKNTPYVWEKGVSLIELISYIALAALILAGISMLVGISIGNNRFQFEQVLTTEDARRQLELMSDTIRNARNTGDNNWLLLAGDNEIGVRTDVDGDGQIEQVTYLLDGNNLQRNIGELGESPQVRIVARSIRNDANQPLFQYYNAEGAQISAGEATSSTVELVIVSFLANVNETQAPEAGEIVTEVKPRAENTKVIRLWPVTLTVPNHTTNAANGGNVTVATTNPDGNTTSSVITMTDLNDGRLGTYTGDHYVHLNYQDAVSGDDLQGWYAWVGPIIVGQQNGNFLEVLDKFSRNGICMGNTMDQLLTTCTPRQVEHSGFIRQYYHIVTYTQLSGEVDYVKDILDEATETPTTPPPSCSTSDLALDPEELGLKLEVGERSKTDSIAIGGDPNFTYEIQYNYTTSYGGDWFGNCGGQQDYWPLSASSCTFSTTASNVTAECTGGPPFECPGAGIGFHPAQTYDRTDTFTVDGGGTISITQIANDDEIHEAFNITRHMGLTDDSFTVLSCSPK